MYNMDQIAGMSRNSLIEVLNDAEKCLVQIEKILAAQNGFKEQKTDMMNQCEKLKKKIKRVPFIPGIIAFVILALFSGIFFLGLIGVIIAAILYKNKQRPIWEDEIANITNHQIPAIDMRISQCDDNLNTMIPWATNVKSLLSLLPQNLRNVQSIRSIREQLIQGAPNWYTAVQSYQSLLREQERDRQIREMQMNVQQVAAASERTAAASERTAVAAEDVRKQTRDIARHSERTAAAAETAARNSARTAAAAESSAKSNEQRARAAERTAANSARMADDVAYWIYSH